MNTALWKNGLTTFFGCLAGLPTIVLGVFTPGTAMALSPQYTHILMVTGGVGLVGLGVVSKAFNVHSTQAEVQASTIETATKSQGPTS
jgi:hypothetical protein